MGLNFIRAILCLSPAGILIGCAGAEFKPPEDPIQKDRQKLANMGKLLGDDTLTFGGDGKSSDTSGNSGIGVNYYLWRASLDTLAFLPTRSADPFGGVILTEWYTPPETPNEQVKVDVRILDRQLRADGVKVSIFKQKRNAHGHWQDIAVSPRAAQELEEAILTRARELKINAR